VEDFKQPLDKLEDELEFKWGRLVTTQVTMRYKLSFGSLKFLLDGIS
jgi:hypothetical protein